MEKTRWMLHVLWRCMLKMKVNNLFFRWQENQMEGSRESWKGQKPCKKNDLCNCIMNKYEQGGNWLSDQRKECIKCVTFINEVYGLLPTLSEDDFCDSDGVCRMVYIYCGMILINPVFCYSKMWSRFGKLGPVQWRSCKNLQVSRDWSLWGTVLHIPCESSEQCWH